MAFGHIFRCSDRGNTTKLNSTLQVLGFINVGAVLQVTHNVGIDYNAALFVTSMTITCPTWQSAFSMSVPDVAFCCFPRFNSSVLSALWFHAMSVPGSTATRMRLKSHNREWCFVEVAILGVAPSPGEFDQGRLGRRSFQIREKVKTPGITGARRSRGPCPAPPYHLPVAPIWPHHES